MITSDWKLLAILGRLLTPATGLGAGAGTGVWCVQHQPTVFPSGLTAETLEDIWGTLGSDLGPEPRGHLVWSIRHSPDRMHITGGHSLQPKNELACFGGEQEREGSPIWGKTSEWLPD